MGDRMLDVGVDGVQVVAFAASLSDSGKYRIPAVFGGYVVNELLYG